MLHDTDLDLARPSQPAPHAETPQETARWREHRLTPPRNLLDRLTRAAQQRIEAFVARQSLNGDPPVYDRSRFGWIATLEAGGAAMRAELDRVLLDREAIPGFHEILKEAATITRDRNWRTFFLCGIGMDCRGNAARCPQTIQLLRQIPGIKTAFFSILSPGTHIPAHRGAYNGLLRLHLALKVPQPQERCRIRIADRVHRWREGEVLIFDDSYEHEVWNDTDGERVVLFVDFARPLRQPWHWLNHRLLNAGALAPFLREANQKQRRWEKDFYR